MSSGLEVLAVKALAKKRGIPEGEAQTIIEAMKTEYGTEGFQRWVSTMSLNAELLSKLPPDLRQNMSLVAAQTLAGGGSGGVDELAAKLAIVKEVFRGDEGGKPPATDPEMRQRIESLQKMMEEMKDEKQKKEWQEMVSGLEERLEKMDEKITAGQTPVESEDSIEKLAKDTENVQNKLAKLSELLGVEKKAAAAPLDVEGMKNELKARGYKVEGPKSPEELEKWMKGELEKVQKDTEARVRDQIKSDERKMGMLLDLGTSIIEAVVPVAAKGGGARGLEVARAALKTAREAGT